jgi:ArsR family transcriptional regulator
MLAFNPVAIAAGFHALSDTTRIEILNLLRDGERCVCELMDTLDAAQSRLSFHLRVLKEAGLVTDRREGRWVYYTIDAGTLATLKEFLSDIETDSPSITRSARRSKDCCR